jgi:hypothetical protein
MRSGRFEVTRGIMAFRIRRDKYYLCRLYWIRCRRGERGHPRETPGSPCRAALPRFNTRYLVTFNRPCLDPFVKSDPFKPETDENCFFNAWSVSKRILVGINIYSWGLFIQTRYYLWALQNLIKSNSAILYDIIGISVKIFMKLFLVIS